MLYGIHFHTAWFEAENFHNFIPSDLAIRSPAFIVGIFLIILSLWERLVFCQRENL
jgi:hypothetical protein